MNDTIALRSPSTRTAIPGACLLGGWPALSALLIALNDFWLKPSHPGFLSGKLSDVGLCFFFPVFLSALGQWVSFAWSALRGRPWRGPAPHSTALACILGAGYFVALKCSTAAAAFHVHALSALLPRRSFRAVSDPTDLVCLPLVLVAYRYLARADASSRSTLP